MTGNGYILLSRSIIDSDVFSSPRMLKIWIWCLCKANHKDKSVCIKVGKGETIVKVKRGSFIFGRHKAEEELDIDGASVYRYMQKFVELNMLTLTPSNQYTIISICNYETYQNSSNYERATNEQPMSNQRATNEQPMSTNKNDKNDNNDKNIEREGESVEVFGEFKNVLITPTEFKALSVYGYDPKDVVEWYSAAKASKNYTSENDYASIKNWGIAGFIEVQKRQGKQSKQSGKTTTSGSLNDLSGEDFWELMRKKYDN